MTMRIEQEPDRVPRGVVRASTLVVAIMILASIGAVLLLGRGDLREVLRARKGPPARIEETLYIAPTPLELLRGAQLQWLRGYGWVDRQKGIVHVPIEVAAELYLQEVAK